MSFPPGAHVRLKRSLPLPGLGRIIAEGASGVVLPRPFKPGGPELIVVEFDGFGSVWVDPERLAPGVAS